MTTMTPGAGPGERIALMQRPEVGRVLSGLGLGLLMAVVTGPNGTGEQPFLGLRGAILAPRVIPYLLSLIHI